MWGQKAASDEPRLMSKTVEPVCKRLHKGLMSHRSPPTLAEEVQSFTELLYAQRLVPRPRGEKPFYDVGLADDFRVKDAVKLLIDTSPSFYGHKEVMYAAFVSWVVAPSNASVRLELIGLRIKEMLAKAELVALRDFGNCSPVMCDLVARYVVAGPQFIEQIYVPFGGMENLSDLGTRAIADHVFDDQRRSFYTIIKMMAVCEHVAANTPLTGKVYPSVNKAVAAVRAFIDPKILSRASIYAKWAECRDSVAWIYAAASIRLDGGTLLDALTRANATYESHGSYFGRWARRTKYFCDHVLKRMPDADLYSRNVSPIRALDGEQFPQFALTTSDLESLKKPHSL